MNHKHGKRYRQAAEKYDNKKQYSFDEAINFVKQNAYAKFDETVDVNVNVGIDVSKGDQVVRGAVTLPHGIGKKTRVIVFTKGEYVAQAEKAGADQVGLEDLIDRIASGWMDFEYAVATPDVMGQVGVLAKQLGPRGLLPNKKVGTVTFDVGHIIKELKSGRMFFKNDKSAVVHFSVGKISFEANTLKENIVAFIKALSSAKPVASKGKFVQKVTISSTMGIGIGVQVEELVR